MTTFGGALGGDPLGGQALGQTKAVRLQTSYVRSFAPGTTTWVCPQAETYRFILKGAGAHNKLISGTTYGGGSGAHCEYGKYCRPGEVVTISSGASVTATFEDGRIVSAGGAGIAPAGGVASGGDLNLNGSAGSGASGVNGANGLGPGGGIGGTGNGSSGGGAGAPGTLDFPGGNGGGTGAISATWPGGGGGGDGGGDGDLASGMALVYRT